MKVLIVGAGLGGLCLAHGLRQAGIEVVVFERDASPNTRGQGHRVHIDSRGERALRDCLPDQLHELYLATRGQASERFMLLSAAGPRLEEVPVPPMPDGSSMIQPGSAVSRLALREILLAGLGEIVRFGKGYSHHETGDDGTVRAHFTDGTSCTGDVLVGADGIGSAVRRQYLPHASVADTGIRWIGGKTPITKEITASLPSELASSFAAVTDMEPSMMVGYLRFRTDPTEAAARLCPEVRISDAQDYVMWAIIVESDRLTGSDAELAATPGSELLQQALHLTERAHPTMRDIIERCWPDQTFFLTMGTAVPIDPWPATAVTLLGDAIHAMPPARASGANTALADAASLAGRLTAVHRGKTPLLTAIAEYEADLRRRGFTAVRASTTALDSTARSIIAAGSAGTTKET